MTYLTWNRKLAIQDIFDIATVYVYCTPIYGLITQFIHFGLVLLPDSSIAWLWACFTISVEFVIFSLCLCVYPPSSPVSSQKHIGRCISYSKLSLDVNECDSVCIVPCNWTGITSRAYFYLVPSVPGIVSRTTLTLIRIKWLLQMSEWTFWIWSH